MTTAETPEEVAFSMGFDRGLDLGKEAAVRFYRDAIVKMFRALGLNEGPCRSCGRQVWWVTTSGNKRAPYTADGVSHFADCPKADKHRRRR